MVDASMIACKFDDDSRELFVKGALEILKLGFLAYVLFLDVGQPVLAH